MGSGQAVNKATCSAAHHSTTMMCEFNLQRIYLSFSNRYMLVDVIFITVDLHVLRLLVDSCSSLRMTVTMHARHLLIICNRRTTIMFIGLGQTWRFSQPGPLPLPHSHSSTKLTLQIIERLHVHISGMCWRDHNYNGPHTRRRGRFTTRGGGAILKVMVVNLKGVSAEIGSEGVVFNI